MSRNAKTRISVSLIANVLGFLAGTSDDGNAATLHVGDNGADIPGCGSVTAPCRSINQSIALASDGDRILVGPGLYGDLDGDGSFASTRGEEGWAAPAACFLNGAPNDCMIHIDKRLKLESTAGAAATVLRSGNAETAVAISADGVAFGKRGRGFTLSGISAFTPNTPLREGLVVTPHGLSAPAPAGVVVEDNVVMRHFTGMMIVGSGHTITNNVTSRNVEGFVGRFAGDRSVVSDNEASDNMNQGFDVATFSNTMVTLSNNRASSNGDNGFWLHGDNLTVTANHSSGNRGHGYELDFGANFVATQNVAAGNLGHGFHFEPSGDGVTLTANVASNNGFPDSDSSDGFSFPFAAHPKLTGNTATANTRYGVYLDSSGVGEAVLTRNALIGNQRGGIATTNGTALVLTQNNIFGNGTIPNDLNSALNCGVISVTLEPLGAEGNYWGAPTGPGNDPADSGCGIVSGFVIDVVPYATRAVSVPVRAGP